MADLRRWRRAGVLLPPLYPSRDLAKWFSVFCLALIDWRFVRFWLGWACIEMSFVGRYCVSLVLFAMRVAMTMAAGLRERRRARVPPLSGTFGCPLSVKLRRDGLESATADKPHSLCHTVVRRVPFLLRGGISGAK